MWTAPAARSKPMMLLPLLFLVNPPSPDRSSTAADATVSRSSDSNKGHVSSTYLNPSVCITAKIT
ncbi:hypothetical protein Hanom_Chr12g01114721 [Helianthus anomalus]